MIRKLFGKSLDTLELLFVSDDIPEAKPTPESSQTQSSSHHLHPQGVIKANDDERFAMLLRMCQADLKEHTDFHKGEWGFGLEQSWEFDGDSGELVFHFPQKTVSTRAQVVGLYNKASATWSWSWSKDSIDDSLTLEARRLKLFGEEEGFHQLTDPSWRGPLADAWNMTAVACRLCRAKGAFCGHSGDTAVYFIFNEVEVCESAPPEQIAG